MDKLVDWLVSRNDFVRAPIPTSQSAKQSLQRAQRSLEEFIMSLTISSQHLRKQLRFISLSSLACAALLAAMSAPAFAASCVNPGGHAGCFSTIGAAVAAARPGSTIKVSPGTYKETVVIGKSLSLIGTSSSNTIIDATGLPNGVFVDGFHNPGLSDVVVSGFTLENANFEGALI